MSFLRQVAYERSSRATKLSAEKRSRQICEGDFLVSGKFEVVRQREHHRAHLWMRRLYVRNHAIRSKCGCTDWADGRDNRSTVERVGERRTFAKFVGDFEKMTNLNLTSDRQRVDLTVDELPERRQIVGEAPLVQTDFRHRCAARRQRVGRLLASFAVMHEADGLAF